MCAIIDLMKGGDIQAVIFDMDGVLIRTAPQHYAAWKRVFAEMGRDFSEEEFRSTFGMRNQEILRRFLGETISGEQVEELGRRKEEYYRALLREGVEPAPGLLELLHKLKSSGIRVAVGTSAPEENVRFILEKLGIMGQIDVLVTEEDVRRGKPDPEVFLLAAERLGVEPAKCLVIEDAPAGIEAAKKAGMCCVAITGTRPREELAGADMVVDGLGEISRLWRRTDAGEPGSVA